MTLLSKVEYYRSRGTRYHLTDPEAGIRYERAMRWMVDAPDQRVVEVGCKFAVLRDRLQARLEAQGLQYSYVGLDIDQATLDRVPGGNQLDLRCHDVNRGVPLLDASVDYLFCFEVMEHLECATAFLDEARRVLRPGGKLMLSVPNPYSWMEVVGNLRGAPDREGHIASFTAQNIDALLRFSGLRLEAQQGTFTRIPFSRRLLGRPALVETDNFFLSRSTMYLIGPRIS